VSVGETTAPTNGTKIDQTGFIGKATTAGTPTSGGTIIADVGAGEPAGLDPIKDTIDGTVGLTEYAAIYDVLMRYDPVANKYVPQLASSLDTNSDHTLWTLHLRPNVTFTDGTPLNAAAVKFNVDRYSTSKDSIQYYAPELAQVQSVATPDDLTVVFTLKSSDGQFPWILTQGLGLVGSPTAIQQQGEQAFSLHPVGAGPFMVTKYTPGAELDVVRNPHYWGGTVYLDGIHFVWPANDNSKLQALNSGDLSIVHMANPVVIENAVALYPGFLWLRYGGSIVMMNERSGHKGADVRVRQAIAYALDPKVFNDRVYQGKSIPSTALFPNGVLHTDTPPLPYDPAKAQSLLNSVKQSTGWDGSIPISTTNDTTAQAQALAVQALLNAVGFHATIDTAPSVSAEINKIYVTFNYDIAVSGIDISVSDPWAQMVEEYVGDSAPNGYNNPDMNAALDQLRAAGTPGETQAATTKIQEIWNATVPEVWLNVAQDTVMWAKNVHGILTTANSAVLLGQAWQSKS
jgi:peptide/nickel transport system substrate-binding protein